MIDNTPMTNRQQSLEGDDQYYNGRAFGDKISKQKDRNVIRIMFQNLDGFGYSAIDKKSEMVKEFIIDYDIDAMLMAELNVNWERMSRKNTLSQIARRWFENVKVSNSYNTHRKSIGKWLPGGTATLIQGPLSFRTNKPDIDSRYMGRWASQTITGKHGLTTRVVSVYVPQPKRQYGEKKVHQQQQEALLKIGISGSVLDVFWADFWSAIDEWIENGEQLIIGGDWNTNTTCNKFLEPFKSRNLVPCVQSRHGLELPATHNNGKDPIDEIFISNTLTLTSSGYLEHGHNTSDHRVVWIEVSKISSIGTNLPKLTSFQARRLKCKDPRVVDRYNKLVDRQCKKNNLFQKAFDLYNNFSSPMSELQKSEYEKIDRLKTEAMNFAEANCRKIKVGGYQWSP